MSHDMITTHRQLSGVVQTRTALIPQSTATTNRTRTSRRLGAMFGVALMSLIGLSATSPTPAGATGSICQTRYANGSDVVRKVVPTSWKYAEWKVYANVRAQDQCRMGEVSVSVGIEANGVTSRGGQVMASAWIRYYNTKSNVAGAWIPLKIVMQYPSLEFRPPNGFSVGMNDTTAAVEVYIVTQAWTQQDGSRWVPVGSPGRMRCNLWYTSRSNPGRCVEA